MELLTVISIVMQVVAILITMYMFRVLSVDQELETGVYNRHELLHRRYQLLKGSLIVVAAITFLQLMSVTWDLITKGGLGGFGLIVSDLVLVILVYLVTKMYAVRSKYLTATGIDMAKPAATPVPGNAQAPPR